MLYPAVVRTLEQYSPQRVRDLIASTKQVGEELRPLIGNRLRETPTTVQISADDILQIAMERGDVKRRRSCLSRRRQHSACCCYAITIC